MSEEDNKKTPSSVLFSIKPALAHALSDHCSFCIKGGNPPTSKTTTIDPPDHLGSGVVRYTVLSFADPSKPFILHVDRSLDGLRDVLNQFHNYLYGARFTERTDNNLLRHVLTTAKFFSLTLIRPGISINHE